MVMPLYDERASGRTSQPYVTWALVALNVAIFIGELFLPESSVALTLKPFGFTPAILAGDIPNPGWLPTLFTPLTDMFIHLGLDHIFGNMLFLLIFGDNVEDALGHFRFAVFYIACSYASDLAYFASNPHSTIPAFGASGAIARVAAAYLLIRPCANIKVLIGWFPITVPAYVVIGLFVLLQVWNIAAHTQDGVGYWAHVGGLIAGGAMLLLMRGPHVQLFQCMRATDENLLS